MKFEETVGRAVVERGMENAGPGGGLSADFPENGYFTHKVADVHVNLAVGALPDPVRFIPGRAIG